ncbi:nitrate- and nitrite sensing domain-containing protein [Nocardia sp. AB354]|uniref:sensor histidine kinase n=1 Tax=Nocardia sp. AB354 TaxID=3413283 RepID=UPI003C1773DB
MALVVTGGVTVTRLAADAHAAKKWSEYLGRQMDLAAHLATAAQNERAASLLALAGDRGAATDLARQRADIDRVFSELNLVAREMNTLNPDAVSKSTPAFTAVATQLPQIRAAVDTGRTDTTAVDDYFATITGIVVLGLQGSARHTPDAVAAAEQMTTAHLVQVADLHSRAVATAMSALAAGAPTSADRHRVGQFTGAYRQQLEGSVTSLTDDGRAAYRALTDSPQWRTSVTGEDQFASDGTLNIPAHEWRDAEAAVGSQLVALFHDHGRYATQLAVDAASRLLTQTLLTTAAITVVAAVAFACALLLANRLIRRLSSLRSRSLELANEQLPSILRRIHGGEEVDLDLETTTLDAGDDEIGSVAYAFGVAQRAAVDAAAAEARTRDGFNKVFLDIAHRSQTVVRRQLDILDLAEGKQDDPEHLELLFRLDHLATRARRNAENLLILGGAQPGRRWHDPVPLEDIVRSAVSETEDFARVTTVRLPAVHVLGGAVADLIHLLAELIDNAATFSPPQSLVTVRGSTVGNGVAVEVEDQGLGIRAEERDRLNELLRNPPEFQEMALAGRRHLGLFVVGRLAARHNIMVTLHESAYGGTTAVALIRSELLQAESHSEVPASRPRIPMDPPPVPRPEAHRTSGVLASAPPSLAPAVDVIQRIEREPGEASAHSLDVSSPRVPLPGRPQLPRRRRQTHLAPQLRLDEQAAPPSNRTAERRRDAAVVRGAMASFQQGTQQARRTTSAQPQRIRRIDNE